MGILGKIFKKKNENETKNVEDFILLNNVYMQSCIAANQGITNIRLLPQVAQFKRMFHVPTLGGKIGAGEKNASKKMLMADYKLPENYFKEIEKSIRKNCKKQNDIQSYLVQFQGFCNDLMMAVGTEMQWKFRLPSFLMGAMRPMVEKTVHKICTKQVWSKDDMHKTATQVKSYKAHLDFSEEWMTDFAYTMVILAKKESKKNND